MRALDEGHVTDSNRWKSSRVAKKNKVEKKNLLLFAIKAGHGCTLRLPGSLPTGIFRKKSIPGSAGILSHGSPGPTGILPAGRRSKDIKGTCRYLVVKLCECLEYLDI